MIKLLNPHYAIRTATATDSEVLLAMWQKIDKEGEPRPFGGDTKDKPQRTREIIEHALTSPQATLLVCTHQQMIVGTITGHCFDKPAVDLTPVGVIYSLWVEPQYRRQGIAQHLLTHLEKTLNTMGAKATQVGWDTTNTTAAQWWQAQGYAPYETIASKAL